MDWMLVLAAIDERIAKLTTAREVIVSELLAPAATPSTTVRVVRQARPPQGAGALPGDHPRRLILAQVAKKPKVWTTSTLAEALSMKPATVLFHLGRLRREKALNVEGAGRATRYLPA